MHQERNKNIIKAGFGMKNCNKLYIHIAYYSYIYEHSDKQHLLDAAAYPILSFIKFQ